MESGQVNYDFAEAWDKSRGSYAKKFAENLNEYASANNLSIKSMIDICCGSSNLLRVFKDKGIHCIGTESRIGMYDYSKTNNAEISYVKTDKMYDIPVKEKVDLITCTGDIVNYFEIFENWKELFKNAIKHLNNNGIFIFDFYTKFKLKDWNEITFTSSEWLDCLTNIKSGLYDKTVINYTYYIRYENYMVKTRDIVVESYYDTVDIIEALKQCGFKNVKLVDHELKPIDNYENSERIYIIASKK